MFSLSLLAPALLLVAGTQAHISIVFPPPFDNKNPDINSPISAAKFPCSGLHKAGGPSTATLIAGAESKITFSGGAEHSGGSCQVALTYDKTNFYVIHSWQGGCPVAGGSLAFTVPSDAPLGDAIFAWTWINKVGNREFYMNCGAVTIAAGTGPAPKVPFLSRPDLFVANLANGCKTPDSTDTIYPDPGPDVTGAGPGNPLTNCQPINGIGNSVRGGAGGSPPPAAPDPPASSAPAVSSPSSAAPSTPATSDVTPLPSMTTVISKSSFPVSSKSTTFVIVKPSSSGLTVSQPSTNGTQTGPKPTFPLFTSSPSLPIPTNLPSGIPSTLSTFSEILSKTGGIVTVTEFTTIFADPTTDVTVPSSAIKNSSMTGTAPVKTGVNTFPLFTSSPILSIPTTLPAGIPSELSTFSELPLPTTASNLPTIPVATSSTAQKPSATSTAPSPSGTTPTTPDSGEGIVLTTDGTCGGNKKCKPDHCCSSASFCGDSALHCGAGCQSAFGICANSVRRSRPHAHAHGRGRFYGAGVAGRVNV